MEAGQPTDLVHSIASEWNKGVLNGAINLFGLVAQLVRATDS